VAAICALTLLAHGCGDTNSCKQGTLLVTVTFDTPTSAADRLEVTVTVAGGTPKQSDLSHQVGSSSGTIEVNFPQGYPEGKRVDVALVARKAGVVLAMATGSVSALPKGCGTLAIRFGSGADGGGVDRPGDAAGGTGGTDGGTGGTGGGAGGTGGTGGGGTGGGAGGATGGTVGTGGGGAGGATGGTGGGGTGGAADAGTCVFRSAEECYNGIDDDCNGTMDCADPACTPSTICVPAPSGGFAAGVWVDAAAPCPTRFDRGETAINAGLTPGAGCSGCSCTASIRCTATAYKYASAAECTADAALTGGTPAASLSLTHMTGGTPSPTCVASTFSATTNARLSTIGVQNGACMPQGAPTLSPAGWTTRRKFCSTASVGAGCTPGYVCVPRSAPNHCVLGLGTPACPAGYAREGTSWFTGLSEGRTCAACTCGTQTAGSCSNLTAQFYFGTSTTCSAGIHRSAGSNTKNCTFSGDCGSVGLSGTPTLPSCPGVSTVSGTVTGTGEQTLCCQ
jgi:hypothetical protein